MWRSATLPYELPLWQYKEVCLQGPLPMYKWSPCFWQVRSSPWGFWAPIKYNQRYLGILLNELKSLSEHISKTLKSPPFQIPVMIHDAYWCLFEEHIGTYVVHILPMIRLGNFNMAPGFTQPYSQLLFLHQVCSKKKRHSRDGCSWLHLCSNFLDITCIELLLLATS